MNINNMKKTMQNLKNSMDPERAKREKREAQKRGVAKGLALGGLVGGLVGVFYAPDKGENTRKKAKGEIDKAKEVLEVNYEEGKEKFNDIYEEKKYTIGEKIAATKSKIAASKEDPNVIDESDLDDLTNELKDELEDDSEESK